MPLLVRMCTLSNLGLMYRRMHVQLVNTDPLLKPTFDLLQIRHKKQPLGGSALRFFSKAVAHKKYLPSLRHAEESMVGPLQTRLQGLLYSIPDGASPRTWPVPLQCTPIASQIGPASRFNEHQLSQLLLHTSGVSEKAKQEAKHQHCIARTLLALLMCTT